MISVNSADSSAVQQLCLILPPTNCPNLFFRYVNKAVNQANYCINDATIRAVKQTQRQAMHSFRFLLIGFTLLLASCSAPRMQASFNTPLTMRELMEWVIDPAADGVWESVAWISNGEGDKDIFPTTQAQWDVVRNSAATLVEAANLLMLDTRAVDQTNWMQAARRLSKTAEIALKAAKDKDVQLVFDIGAEIYNACSSCHRQYADFYKNAQAWPSLTVLAGRSTSQTAIQFGLKAKEADALPRFNANDLKLIAQAVRP